MHKIQGQENRFCVTEFKRQSKMGLDPPSGTVPTPSPTPSFPPLPQHTVMYVNSTSFLFLYHKCKICKNAIHVHVLVSI